MAGTLIIEEYGSVLSDNNKKHVDAESGVIAVHTLSVTSTSTRTSVDFNEKTRFIVVSSTVPVRFALGDSTVEADATDTFLFAKTHRRIGVGKNTRFAAITTSVGLDFSPEFMVEVAKGNVPGHSFVHKFGSNTSVSTSVVPVSSAGVYQTPTSAVSLEFVSSAAGDALNGAGMHELTIQGLDATGALQTVSTAAHATDGTTAVNITGTWLRVFRAYVSSSGTYASAVAGSHVGTITIRVQGAGATYAQIPLINSFPIGQSLIGAYTVPLGKTAYILSAEMSSDVSGTKTTNYFFFKRENMLDTSSSYSGIMRIQNLKLGTQGIFDTTHQTPESYPALTDIGFMAYASTTSIVSAEFELLLVDDGY